MALPLLKKEQMTNAAVWIMYQAVNKFAEEHEIWKDDKENLQQELQKLRLQNEGMQRDLQISLMQNIANAQLCVNSDLSGIGM